MQIHVAGLFILQGRERDGEKERKEKTRREGENEGERVGRVVCSARPRIYLEIMQLYGLEDIPSIFFPRGKERRKRGDEVGGGGGNSGALRCFPFEFPARCGRRVFEIIFRVWKSLSLSLILSAFLSFSSS